MLIQRDQHVWCRTVAALILMILIAVPVSAQDNDSVETRTVGVRASFDVLNDYVFRGVRQNSTGLVMWPSIDLDVTPYSGGGALEQVQADFGFWNSLHTGDTGSAGPSGDRWYESRFNATLGLRFAKGISIGTTYTAYTSPNDMFTTVKEVAVRVALDDREKFGRGALRPYALVAMEVDTQVGVGQLDGGFDAGRYLEVGATPGYAVRRARVDVPVRVGLSLSNYYELAGKDNAFGFFSVGGIVTVPVVRTGTFGVNVRGGVDFQVFGDTTKVFNGGDGHKTIGLVGVGLSY